MEQKYTHIKIKKIKDKLKITSRRCNPLFLLLRIFQNILIQKTWTFQSIFILKICIMLLISCVSAHKEQKFAMEPQDQSAVVGSRVTLPCRVVNKVGQLQWTKDDFGLGTHRHLTGYERYKMIGSDEEGDYSLDIRDVTLEDDALYQCQVSTGPKGEPAIRSQYARLMVLVPPEPPRIIGGPVVTAVEDQDINLECVSVGGKPAAEITWVDHEGSVLGQGVTYSVEEMADRRRFIARSIINIRPKRSHHDQTFTCQAQNTADRAYRSTTVKIKVQYAPRVRVTIKSKAHNGRIREGDTVVLGCQASANPNNLTYNWYVNNMQVTGAIGNELMLSNVSKDYNEASVKCEAHNIVGRSSDTKTLEVAYGPVFKIKPHNVEADDGASETLSCVVDGHPRPKTLWLRYEHDRVIRVGKASNLSITVSKQTAGQYWCRASVDNYQDIEAVAVVYVKGPPKIRSNRTQYGVEGDSVRIECISFSVPKPDLVIWTYGGNEINSFHDHEFAFLEESLDGGLTKSTLVIRKSSASHFGVYNCTVSNAYGSDSIDINLVPDKSMNLVIVISSGAFITVVILVIMFIVMLCHRRVKKADDKKPDITDMKTCVDKFKDCDRSDNISDLKLELRQVEGSCDMDVSTHEETEFRSTLQLTTNLGLPLAGPVPVPETYDNKLMKYQRYSGDFDQPINNIHFKTQDQSAYVPYVDYSRDYAPPSDSLTGSLSRSTDMSTYQSHCGSLNRQASCGRIGAMVGPDVIPMANPGAVMSGVDVRYAATYGNPYLRGSNGPPLSYVGQSLQSSKNAPPPYYTLRNNNHRTTSTITNPPCSSSSRPVTSPPNTSCAQPQVPKTPPSSLHYVLPSGQNVMTSSQISTKGNGSLSNITHV
ncbi:irregular chiasm C-roughest protein-like [Aricia agestis]|uniref:irregular chiasm C-roughest protein-like n=1 Tax=Aricia agestis TaxID=91739 RepID=UPI001C207A6C|nr:irregular chiasm C-roughest protein-like [Aricia agestis]